MDTYTTAYTPPSSEEDTKSAFCCTSDRDDLIPNAAFIPQTYFIVEDSPKMHDDNEPYLEIKEQPVEKFRFRYKSEMAGTHGSLTGMSTERVKTYPTVQLHNFPGSAVVRCSLFQINGKDDGDSMLPHAHRLIKKHGTDELDDPHEIVVSKENNFMASFHGMGIIHTAKKNIMPELIRKKMQLKKEDIARREGKYRSLKLNEEMEIKGLAEEESKSINLNTVCLRFDAFLKTPNEIYKPICEPVFTHGINNLKSALTGELKIVRMDHCTSPSTGNREIFILVEKVTKKNIKIRFFEIDEDENVVWENYGRFSDLDVHHQYAIVFKTPPYRERDIPEKVKVYVELVRPSDNSRSEPKEFVYTPCDVVGSKRARSSSYSTSGYSSSVSSTDLPETLNYCTNNIGNISFGSHEVNSEEMSKQLKAIEFEKLFTSYGQEYFNLMGPLTDAPASNKNSKSHFVQKRVSKEEYEVCRRVSNEFVSIIQAKKSKGQVEQLLDHYFGSRQEKHNALHIGIRIANLSVVKYFLKLFTTYKKVQLVNTPNENNETALHVALKYGTNIEIVKVLMMLQPNLKLKDMDGNTPLHIAVKQDNGVLVYHLLNVPYVKEFINEENNEGDTALKISIDNEQIKILKQLCQKNADVNKINKKDGTTSLHCAVRKQNLEIVKYLLQETKVDTLVQDYSEANALKLASALMKNESPESCEVFKIIKEHMERRGYATNLVLKQELEDESSEEEMEFQKEEITIVKNESLSAEDLKSLYNSFSVTSEKWKTCLNAIAKMLDETQGWQYLLDLLDLHHLTKTNLFQKNPSHTLLSYAAVNGQAIYDIRNLLESLNELEVVAVLDNLVSLSS